MEEKIRRSRARRKHGIRRRLFSETEDLLRAHRGKVFAKATVLA